MTMKRRLQGRTVCGVVAAFSVLIPGAAVIVARAQEPTAPAQTPAPPAAPAKRKIPDEIVKMVEAHNDLKSFSGVITIEEGIRGLTFIRETEITLAFRRPNRLRAVITTKYKRPYLWKSDVAYSTVHASEPEKVFVDGKNVYVFQNEKWTSRPFKEDGDLFEMYAGLVQNPWAGDLFTNPSFTLYVPLDLENVSFERIILTQGDGEEHIRLFGLRKDVAQRDTFYTNYEFGKKDSLLRSRTVEISPTRDENSAPDIGSPRARYSRVEYNNGRANPNLPDSLFVLPASEMRKVKPAKD